MDEKFYRNTITVEVLSNEPWDDGIMDLELVRYEISEGASIGNVTRAVVNQELTQDEAIAAEKAIGGDGTFLLNELMSEIDEEDSE